MKSKIIVPSGMQAAIAPIFREWFQSGSHHGELEDILRPALKWLMENPIMPTAEQWKAMPMQDDVLGHIREWQRRMFLEFTRPCPRCGLGIDDDEDGDCAVCARLSDRQVEHLKRMPQS